MKADLHVHTTASDGAFQPRKLLEEAAKAGVELLSATDHDSVSNLELLSGISKFMGIKFIPGVEINTALDGNYFHILGYGFDFQNRNLNRFLNLTKKNIDQKNDECIRLIEKKVQNVNFQEYEKYENDPARGGWKALNYLIDKGVCKSGKHFVQFFYGEDKKIDPPVFPTPGDAIDTVRKAGGFAVLAHPGSTLHKTTLAETLRIAEEEGIQGLECYHPVNDEDTKGYCVKWCLKKGMIITGGSDFHNVYEGQENPEFLCIDTHELRLGGLERFL